MTPAGPGTLRPATAADIPQLADIWHDGWHEAHAAHVPPALTALRSTDSFITRLGPRIQATTVLMQAGRPQGLCIIEGAELYQLYVAPGARASGGAAALLQDGERRMAATGVTHAHLLCLPENPRARRFYERQGWQLDRIDQASVETLDGPFPLRLAIYEKWVTAD